jgi:LCP family protein required for cell wall assembly
MTKRTKKNLDKEQVTLGPLRNILTRINVVLIPLAVAFSTITVLLVIASGLVPAKYIALLALALACFGIGTIVLFIKFHTRMTPQIVSIIFALISSVIAAATLYGIVTAEQVISTVTNDSSIPRVTLDQAYPFNLYISGIDTYGTISTVSRSDVNIVITINPLTKHILLTTIPRDSYVKIADGGNNQYDKLTHAGIYGIKSSMDSVSNLLDTPIHTYARINFSSFVSIIDQIGGIDVENPVAFVTDFGQVFKQGTLHLDGTDALTFSRERHNLIGGDNDRGVNQERVITAIFKKASSHDLLKNYLAVLQTLSTSVQTNIANNSLKQLVNQLLSDGSSWSIDQIAITGSGETGHLPSYAMPNAALYMLVINSVSLQITQQAINTALTATK